MCGEHTGSKRHASNPTGSSPHVRGARRPSWRRCRRRGIIPACAGSTKCQCGRISFIGDHPRMCGEHLSRMSPGCGLPGSSPHVRGAHVRRLRVPLVSGIIPACAGSTNSSMVFPVDKRDHPRMCGEHGRVVTVNGNVKGSSPHVRGAREAPSAWFTQAGIIPAYAGSTVSAWPAPCSIRDHPRMCGEHVRAGGRPMARRGSSPHVRGAPTIITLRSDRTGIIPACAGSTR